MLFAFLHLILLYFVLFLFESVCTRTTERDSITRSDGTFLLSFPPFLRFGNSGAPIVEPVGGRRRSEELAPISRSFSDLQLTDTDTDTSVQSLAYNDAIDE